MGIIQIEKALLISGSAFMKIFYHYEPSLGRVAVLLFHSNRDRVSKYMKSYCDWHFTTPPFGDVLKPPTVYGNARVYFTDFTYICQEKSR